MNTLNICVDGELKKMIIELSSNNHRICFPVTTSVHVYMLSGQMDLTSKQLVTSLISHHLSVVLWFVETGLLPENDGKRTTQLVHSSRCCKACCLIELESHLWYKRS